MEQSHAMAIACFLSVPLRDLRGESVPILLYCVCMRVLLTGFEPFGGSSVNPSQEVVRIVEGRGHDRLHERGIELHTRILPVEARRGPATLLRAVKAIKPDAVICMGESGLATAITIESNR